MCTVTYLPLANNDFILTSNRDVTIRRVPASVPQIEQLEAIKLIYPKDGAAGGTWMGANDNGRVVCLLNGGFEKHIYNPPYRKSRGLVVKDILSGEDLDILETYDLKGIEPFTLLVLDAADEFQFRELVWDGTQKHLTSTDTSYPKIWSSSTLYDSAMRAKRKDWFGSWLIQNARYSQDQILDFHETAGEGDPTVDVQMNRGIIRTVSISSIHKRANYLTFFYHDCITDRFSSKTFDLKVTATAF